MRMSSATSGICTRFKESDWNKVMCATKALYNGYSSFQKALTVMASDAKQKPETIHEAKCLLKDLSKKETAVMSVFWAVILERINKRC